MNISLLLEITFRKIKNNVILPIKNMMEPKKSCNVMTSHIDKY